MAVVALSEKGLQIDVLSESPLVLPSHSYVLSGSRLVSARRGGLDFVDLSSKKVLKQEELSNFLEMKISRDGLKTAVLLTTRRLVLFIETSRALEVADVDFFTLSDSLLCLKTTGGSWYIYRHGSSEPLYTENSTLIKAYAFNTFMIFLVKEDSSAFSIYLFKEDDGTKMLLIKKDKILDMVVDANGDESACTVLVDIEYSSSSYYADSLLYLLSLEKMNEEESTSRQKGEHASLVKSGRDYSLFFFSSIKRVHMVQFVGKGKLAVCFGSQPAAVFVFNIYGRLLKKLPPAVRNKVFFTSNEERVLNAGLGNLPGNIEVFDNGTTTCRFERLGTSIAEWLNNGTHFLLCTTSYFKSDNSISVYDYYGRCVKKIPFESLEKVTVYGGSEDSVVLSPPEKLNIVEPVAAYVPPHLAGRSVSGVSVAQIRQNKERKQARPAASKEQKKKQEPLKMTKEELQLEIEECQKLKERLGNGEDLPLSDQKRVFSLRSLLEEYKKMTS